MLGNNMIHTSSIYSLSGAAGEHLLYQLFAYDLSPAFFLNLFAHPLISLLFIPPSIVIIPRLLALSTGEC